VVDDCTPDDGATERVVKGYSDKDSRVLYVRQPNNQGVANARNLGISLTDTRYVCCLDADDAIEPQFMEACIRGLKNDPSLGIAYTGLQYILPSGKTGVSKWPGKWDFDAQLKRQNQVPTCCVMRRDMWEQLGGYKSRYCPIGAGSEDAEFWTRCGEYGWKAEQVTQGPLFVYSWQSGHVSGNKNYSEVDWLAWHPWKDGKEHLFASYSKPKRWSHAVRQYDEPVISVVIPVGPGHERNIENALDSLEAQTFRKWEAILVNDTGAELPGTVTPEDGGRPYLLTYPYARIITTEGRKGAGYARNRGAEAAAAPLIVWLDADDWLYPEALEKMLVAWELEDACVYTDFVGKATVDDVGKLAPDLRSRVLFRDEKTKDTVIEYKLPDYNWERAQRQPESDQPWIWCNVTTLTPRKWHREIGGFDEQMPAWEDVDYWYRMAFSGKPFVRVPEPLLVYLFYGGNRRDTGFKNHQDLISYLLDKYREVEKMPCSGCGKRKAVPAQAVKAVPAPGRVASQPVPPRPKATIDPNRAGVGDNDFVEADYISPNRGSHHLVGHAVFSTRIGDLPMVAARNVNGFRLDYGYRAGGERFLVHRKDVQAAPPLFVQVSIIRAEEPQTNTPPPVSITELPQAPAEPEHESLDMIAPDEELTPFTLQKLPGISATIAEALSDRGVRTLRDIIALGDDGLQTIRGIGGAWAAAIMEAAKKQSGQI
jgi:glycosyltransferase involved in cell wall biosynthesis